VDDGTAVEMGDLKRSCRPVVMVFGQFHPIGAFDAEFGVFAGFISARPVSLRQLSVVFQSLGSYFPASSFQFLVSRFNSSVVTDH